MFKGQFKFKNSNGTSLIYKKGDVVVDQGRMYQCSRTTQKSPQQDKYSWFNTGLSEPYKGTNPPINPVENQLWINDSGVMYVWFKDSNGYQWIST
jgi:hypothetical protein